VSTGKVQCVQLYNVVYSVHNKLYVEGPCCVLPLSFQLETRRLVNLEGGGLVCLEGRGMEGDDGGGLSAASSLLGLAPETLVDVVG